MFKFDAYTEIVIVIVIVIYVSYVIAKFFHFR